MSFLNPLLLWGLAAVAVPVIIHLMFRRRVQRIAWAAMRFLHDSVVRHRQRLRLEDLFLLLLRCLLVAALALAFARPASGRLGAALAAAREPVLAVLILDNSASMGLTDGVTSRFDQARQAAEQILAALPTGSSAALLLAADTVTELVAEPSRDFNLLRKSIREAPLSDRASDLLPAWQRAVDILRARAASRKIIYCFSDRQALAWRHAAEIQQLLAPHRPAIQARIVVAEGGDEENLAVTGLRLAGGLPAVGQPLRCEVEVRNFGRHECRQVPVRISVDGQPPADAAVLESVPPRAARRVTLFVRVPDPGDHVVTARLLPDRLPADDQRTMIVAARRRFDVLLVDGQPSRSPAESATFYLQHALQPVGATEVRDFFVQVTTVSLAELATKQWEDYQAVMFADVPELPAPVVAALERYLRRGGGAVFFPGPNTRAAHYNQVLLDRQGLLPARLGDAVGALPPDADSWFTLQAAPYDHPVVTLWNDPAAGQLDSARFYRAYRLVPAPAGSGAPGGRPRVVVRFADGAPAVMERAWGAGRVVLFASTANTAWNDLPVRPAFVPLLFRLLGWLVQEQTQGLTIAVGETFSYRTRDELAHLNVTVTPPPAGQSARGFSQVDVRDGVPLVQFDRTDWGGVYQVAIDSEPPTAVVFAAQPEPAESDLTSWTAAQQEALRAVADLVVWPTGGSWRETAGPGGVRGEWWWLMVLVAVVVAGAETVAGYRFSRAK
jgi:hypothetical protein